jgi:RNA polymerase sigma factor (sigma-70 family)
MAAEGGAPPYSLRELAPRVLATIVRRYRDFARCEDAVQEALVAAVQQWPAQGRPENPLAWLVTVASRRIADEVRAETARRLRERLVVSLVPADEQIALAADEAGSERDDTLDLFFMCCHPSLSPASQIALTLRAVGGLTTAEIARAFLVPEATMAQRLSRAKQTIKTSGGAFPPPSAGERRARLSAVLHVLYLIFSEGYAATSGESVVRVDLSDEAVRVTRLLAEVAPEDPEVKGLLALMILTDARRAARSTPEGDLVPLDAQDRRRWDRAKIAEGTALVDAAIARGAVGPYQLQAAVAALHDEASSTETTDWVQIVALYEALLRVTDNPVVRLSHAIARAMVEGPAAGLAALDALAPDPRLRESHRLDAARAHLLERAGDLDAAIVHYRRAAGRTVSAPERNYLLLRAARLAERG